MKKTMLVAAVVLLNACSGSDPVMVAGNPADATDPDNGIDVTDNGDTDNNDSGNNDTGNPAVAETTATYRVTFNATWSADTHPLDFPSNAHFSGLVGAVHNAQVQFWNTGQLATDGIELMAETGGKSSLLMEVDSAIANGYASSAISGGGIGTSPDSVSVEFEVSQDYPQVTLVTMVAPSPDWFVGVHNYSLLQDGNFVTSRVVDLAVYDAGTDSGARYTSADIDTDSPAPIMLLTSQPEDSPFLNGQPWVGQFVFEKL